MSDLPAGKGGGPSPFVNAFDHPQLNSLRYNTSMAGSPVHLAYGTTRVSVNLLEFWGFTGSAGGKGGKGLGSSGGKKGSNQQFSVNVAFGLCQGPVSFTGGAAGPNRHRSVDEPALRRRLSRSQSRHRRQPRRLGPLLSGGAARNVLVARQAAARGALARGDRAPDGGGGRVVRQHAEDHSLWRPAARRERCVMVAQPRLAIQPRRR